MVLAFVLLLVGFVILIKGADFLVTGAASLARRYNVSSLVIGLTIVAFGTSAPELVVNVVASAGGHNDATFGNVIGSNNFNILFILGVAGLIYPLDVQRRTVRFEVPISLLAALVLFLLVNDMVVWNSEQGVLSRPDAFLLLFLFAAFMVYIFRSMRGGPDFEEEFKVKVLTVPKSILFSILGLLFLVAGGELAVDNAVKIARHFEWSEKIIGLTILAIGTSLPELATSAMAAYRRHTDIAIGNVIGSNIFNILFVMGISGIIRPAPYNTALNFDVIVLLASTVVLLIFMFTINRSRLDRWEAVILLAGYVTYAAYLIGMEV